MIWDKTTLLMVDPTLVAEETETSMVVEEAYKHPANPIVGPKDRRLVPTKVPLHPGNGICWPSLVARDGSRWRLWYHLRGVDPDCTGECNALFLRYAESGDGVSFRPARVPGRRDNLIPLSFPSERGIRLCGFLHDPLDTAYPYKCVVQRWAPGARMEPGVIARWPHLAKNEYLCVWGVARSRDGFRWEPPCHRHNLIDAAPEHARLHRAMNGDMVLCDQMVNPMAEWAFRNVKGWVTRDLETAHRIPDYVFSLPQHMVRIDQTYSGLALHGTPWAQPHVGLVCARKGPTMIALHGYLYHTNGTTGAETFAQTAEVGLAASETGFSFREIWPFHPFVRRGLRGAWDSGMVAQEAFVETETETRFYYGGGNGNFSPYCWLGLAFIPRDRFGYRLIKGYRRTDLRDARGEFRLKPFELPAKPRFSLNVSHVTPRRAVRLQLADDKGRPLPGYRFKDCAPVTREGLRQTVRWKNDRTGADLGGRKVVISVEMLSPGCRVVMTDSPRVYAIQTA